VSKCIYCPGESLTSPAGDVVDVGDPVICGQCGGLMVVDLHPSSTDEERVGTVRRPTPEESVALRKRADVARFLKAFDQAVLEGLTAGRRAPQVVQPGTLRAYGPDHPSGRH